MFEQLFQRPRALARQQTGPLREERLRFLAHQAAQGMGRRTLRETALYLLIVARYLRLADRPGEAISRAEIERQARRWADRTDTPKRAGFSHPRCRFIRYATRWLRLLGRLQPLPATPHPYAPQIAGFAEFLSRERGLAATTIEGRCRTLRLLLRRLRPSGGPLGQVTVAQLDDALVGHITDGHYARATVQDCAGTLRSFFRYAERQGWCHPGLAATIKAPRVFTQQALPAGPSWDQVRQALALTEGDRAADIRDRALLLLFAVYGLRASEVIRLRLEDFDWERELLTIRRSKSGRGRTYPLAGPVGAAVLRYLKEARPRTALREVFLTHGAPLRPVSGSTLFLVVRRRLRVVSPSLPHYGPHALRHACATHLLEQGLSLKEIGDHLGHRHPDTTRIYTKVDLRGLRQVADLDLGGVL